MSHLSRRALILFVFIGGLIFTVVGWIGNISDLAEAPQRLRELSELWFVQALINPVSLIGMGLAFGSLAYLGWQEDWFEKISNQIAGHNSGFKLHPQISHQILPQHQNRPAISFWLPGPSSMTPFRIEKVDSDFDGLIYSEQLWLRIQAEQNIRDVRVQILILQKNEALSELWLENQFCGSVTKGMRAEIQLLDRRFQLIPAIASKRDGRKKEIITRFELNSSLLPGSPKEVSPSLDLYTFQIKVFHADGPDAASFILKLSESFRPTSKVLSPTGELSFLSER